MKQFFCILTLLFCATFGNAAEKKASTPDSQSSNYKFELRTAPIAFIAKWTTIDISYFINEHWAIGPSYIRYGASGPYGNMFLPTWDGYAIGGHFILAENLQTTGYYLATHIYSENYKSYPEAYLGYYKRVGTRVIVTVGERWVSGNFTTQLGAGFEGTSYDITKTPDTGSPTEYTDSGTGFTIEFKMGLMF